MIQRLVLFFGLFLALTGPLLAQPLKEAMEDAAKQLQEKPKIAKNAEKAIVIQVVNIHNQQTDATAKKIETSLYMALEKFFPEFKLVFLSDSLSGINLSKALVFKGTYDQKGEKTTLNLAGIAGLGGEVIGQAEVVFETEKTTKETLVAVLDIEAKDLNKDQIKAFSDLFRSSLSSVAPFKLASSADVDKMNPEQIQKTSGCTRDECATLIGEQLGVDRVVSTSLFKINDTKYMLSAKIMAIQDGSILVSKTVQHNSDLSNLDVSLEKLSLELVGKTAAEISGAKAAPVDLGPRITSDGGDGYGWGWHLFALAGAGGTALLSSNAAKDYNSLATKNADLKTQYDASNSTATRATIKTEYDANVTKMKADKAAVQTFDSMTIVFGLMEGYFIFFGGSSESAQNLAAPARQWQFALLPGFEHPTMNFSYQF
ncbi:MAG: hypothetical protein A2600_00665 [Candidatus Lambdaproteobacteria bacterium RIFOXYD1_FULL_56_27]|uniref:FlgO domain-containing protein n=1 Tax=Candidatus Lambdaproteobacteria bacterium RIFOXYD2_FULL_56_26 TaxID=1817773 RepID=A0A1F6GLR9_9PROT|nr:MAG: hypothetical protein A2557_09855 [Candidatus Lambdaproteobacteria bacterium RIFOXYD2_FULL_56_26]OGH01443.1 MAG: hypothetical protein A2426_08640 [Candidatus Lambdaproteobacteria bacterium RIFOXYC1_FULL_56_13]OGH07069.1 MAG: hypothetical protein A2600_00665 [Candidatus Lambdaproteobacteria bacterium RIFOXYD1_FULL_56_27]